MTTKPILFSLPMIVALRAGRKTVTRRLHDRPRYKVGDQCWVQETWCVGNLFDHLKPTELPEFEGSQLAIDYRADPVRVWSSQDQGKWRPGRFMCKRFSRSTIEIVNVRQEPLQDITEADAIAEGVLSDHGVKWPDGDPGTAHDVYRRCYRALWDQLNPERPYASNPTPFRYEFRRIK